MYLSQSSASLLNYAISLIGLCTLTVSPETLICICMYMYVHVYIYTLCGCNPIFEAVVLLQHGRWKRHVVSSKVTSKQYNIHTYMYMDLMERSYRSIPSGTYRVILRIVKAGCHPVAIAQVVEH